MATALLEAGANPDLVTDVSTSTGLLCMTNLLLYVVELDCSNGGLQGRTNSNRRAAARLWPC